MDQRPHKLYDKAICKPCKNKSLCDPPCEPLRWVNGKEALREKLLSEPLDDHFELIDYNSVLADLSHGFTSDSMMKSIIGIRNFKLRLIFAGLAVGIPRQEIAVLLTISRTQLYRILDRAMKKSPLTSGDSF
jgi:hypothetical protein